ncbi:MAG: flagellar hook-basal body protein [Solirubrobacteraceae bacterium]|nr:flagellar hook-basal body protein [Solirubrobacteraceae bacterium]
MERGLYIAASGMLAEQVRQDQIANDLANVATPGYKADRSARRAFGDLLLSNTVTGAVVGGLGAGAQIAETVTDLSAQPLRTTGEPLDFAIEGDGFFAVRTEAGIRYTRNGAFTAGPGGILVDQLGNPVLSQNGQTIRVGSDGTVDPGRLGVFAVNDAEKVGDSLFTGQAAGTADGRVTAGALEGSGVDPARAMVDMIASLRSFEAGQKAIQTIDETLRKATTQVGTVTGF